MTKIMEEELTHHGIKSLNDEKDVEKALSKKGSTMVVVNSVCGCSAHARPAAVQSLQREDSGKLPDHAVTVFAGVDFEATAKAREFFTDQQPSSPSIALLKDGKLLFMLHREDLQGKTVEELVPMLYEAFDKHL